MAGPAWSVLPQRELRTVVGPVTVRIPRVRAKTGEAVTFRSALVLLYLRKMRSLEAELPWWLKAAWMNTPELAIRDDPMESSAALDEVYGETRQQRFWMHKTMNVLSCLPKSTQDKAKQSLHDV